MGVKLLDRSGRKLMLTEAGQVVYRYAREIFNLGQELSSTLKGQPTGRCVDLRIGLSAVLPKRLAYRLIEPAYRLPTPVRLICREEPPDQLFKLLATGDLDVMLSDTPSDPSSHVRAFDHFLGECGVAVYGKREIVVSAKQRFPRSVASLPWLLPTDRMALRRSLNRWFDAVGIRPTVVGEFDDYSMLFVVALRGHGIFAAPHVLDRELRREFGFACLGRMAEVTERYYAISLERKIRNPGVDSICKIARRDIFL